MKKLFFLFLVLTNSTYSQEIVNQFDIKLNSNRDVFQIVKDSLKEVNLFISDRKKITSFLLDSKLEIKDSISEIRPDKKFKDILGYSSSDNNYTIYWSTTNKKEIYNQSFDLKNRKVKSENVNFDFLPLNEKFLESFSVNGKFYILKISQTDFSLMLYEFFENKVNRFKIDTEKFKLNKSSNQTARFYDIVAGSDIQFELNGAGTFESAFSLTKIDTNNPTTLSESAKKRKVYVRNNEILISLDYSKFKTQIIKIDLETKSTSLIEIGKTKLSDESVKSNSFIIEDKIFQIVISDKNFSLSLKELNGKIIKEYLINENEKFKINNTPFIRENLTGSERELETTSQFLRKIARSNVGVSVYSLNGNYLVYIGSVSAEKSGGGFGMPMGGFGMPVGGGFTLQPVNFTMTSYYNYKGRRSISTNCLFNKELIHLPVEINEIAFDKIKEYEGKYEAYVQSPTLFKLENDYIYGFYNEAFHNYSFRKFNDQ